MKGFGGGDVGIRAQIEVTQIQGPSPEVHASAQHVSNRFPVPRVTYGLVELPAL